MVGKGEDELRKPQDIQCGVSLGRNREASRIRQLRGCRSSPNCVINLSPDKSEGIQRNSSSVEAWRRIIISDILRSGEMPEEIRKQPRSLHGLSVRAHFTRRVEKILSDWGFQKIAIIPSKAAKRRDHPCMERDGNLQRRWSFLLTFRL